MLRRCVVSIVVGGLADLPKLCGVLFAGGLVVELKPSAATAVIEPTCSRLQSGRLHVVQHRNIVQRVGCIERTCNRCPLWLWLRRPSITVRRVMQNTNLQTCATVWLQYGWHALGNHMAFSMSQAASLGSFWSSDERSQQQRGSKQPDGRSTGRTPRDHAHTPRTLTGPDWAEGRCSAPRACCSFERTVSRRLLFTGSPLGAGLSAAGGADFEVLALLAFDALLTADVAEATDDAEDVLERLGGATYRPVNYTPPSAGHRVHGIHPARPCQRPEGTMQISTSREAPSSASAYRAKQSRAIAGRRDFSTFSLIFSSTASVLSVFRYFGKSVFWHAGGNTVANRQPEERQPGDRGSRNRSSAIGNFAGMPP